MESSFAEKRSSPRTFFNNGEKIAAAINGKGGDPFFVDILNISSGGLQLSQKRTGSTPLQQGEHITLVGLSGLADLADIKEVRMEVRWVINQEFLDIVSAGCRFHGMSPGDQEKIQRLVVAREKLQKDFFEKK